MYLEEDLWGLLRARARQEGTTISELVRHAVREQYLGNFEQRREAMLAFVGSRRGHTDRPDPTAYIRALRRGNRIERLRK
jgi:hypothetical protein